MLNQIKVIGFDADDTLWENENFFRESEEKFEALLKPYTNKDITQELFQIEINNLNSYGYGIKSFILSMIETAMQISDSKIEVETIGKIIALGKEMINKPVVLIPKIKDTLDYLLPKYKLIIATKGDLKDQERKLEKSSLSKYFHHIEIMTDKTEAHYKKLLKLLEIQADEFMMVGNSIKSDIIPVLNLGGFAAHIPFHTTWQHEDIKKPSIKNEKFYELSSNSELKSLF